MPFNNLQKAFWGVKTFEAMASPELRSPAGSLPPSLCFPNLGNVHHLSSPLPLPSPSHPPSHLHFSIPSPPHPLTPQTIELGHYKHTSSHRPTAFLSPLRVVHKCFMAHFWACRRYLTPPTCSLDYDSNLLERYGRTTLPLRSRPNTVNQIPNQLHLWINTHIIVYTTIGHNQVVCASTRFPAQPNEIYKGKLHSRQAIMIWSSPPVNTPRHYLSMPCVIAFIESNSLIHNPIEFQ